MVHRHPPVARPVWPGIEIKQSCGQVTDAGMTAVMDYLLQSLQPLCVFLRCENPGGLAGLWQIQGPAQKSDPVQCQFACPV